MLRPEEKAALSLRELYESHGYSFYKMSRFEEYDFYADKKDFLASKAILTFTDINGKLMALRPDVTLSIVKHAKDSGEIQKYYYDEKVYRVPKNANSFHEISQAGIECIGSLDDESVRDVIELAVKSLKLIAGKRKCILDIADAGVITDLLKGNAKRDEILKCIAEKNIHGLKNLNAPENLIMLAEIQDLPDKALHVLDDITDSHCLKVLDGMNEYYDEIRIDFSAVNNLNYYNGIVFRGFIEGIPESILSGGEYDNLIHMMGRDKASRALGFAVYLDLTERGSDSVA